MQDVISNVYLQKFGRDYNTSVFSHKFTFDVWVRCYAWIGFKTHLFNSWDIILARSPRRCCSYYGSQFYSQHGYLGMD